MVFIHHIGTREAVVANVSTTIETCRLKSDEIAIILAPTVHDGVPTSTLHLASYCTPHSWDDPADLAKAVCGHLMEVPSHRRIEMVLLITSLDFYRHNSVALGTVRSAISFIQRLVTK